MRDRDPRKSRELADLGVGRVDAGDLGNGVALLGAALDEDPDSVSATMHLARVASNEGRWAVAAAAMRRVIAVDPNCVGAWTNLGLYLTQMQRFDEAHAALRGAEILDPGHAALYHNRGLLRYNQNRVDEAVSDLSVAREMYARDGKDDRGVRSDLAHAVLKSGRLNEGLALYEVRWEGMLTKLPVWECGLPRWTGEPLDGKTLLVHSEQGHGDAVQFFRFVVELRRRGARVLFAAPAPLVRLLDGQCGCDEVFCMTDLGALVRASRAADYHVPLISAVHLIGAEFDGQPEEAAPYLRPVPSPTGRRTPVRGAGYRVGLIWAASPGHQRSRERSVPLEDLIELNEVPGVRLYSLQVGPYREDLARVGPDGFVVDLAAGIEDFADTAAIAAELDLVVSVDTGPLHVVAATGVRTWLVQPACPCWRWSRGAKIWYGCVDEYHQDQPGSWRRPIEQMKRDLAGLASTKRAREVEL